MASAQKLIFLTFRY